MPPYLRPPAKPRVTVYLALNFQNRPEKYLGLTSDAWNLGKDGEPLSLSELAAFTAKRVIDFYLTVMPDASRDDLQAEISKAAKMISHLRIKETSHGNT